MVDTVDLTFQGRRGVIAAGLIDAPGGLVVVDPGPASTLEALGAALRQRGGALEDVRAILVTHIHLDHSGGVGVLVRERPDVRVFVHERGAPHLIDPSKLLESAARLYSDRMQALWGDILPVAAEKVEVVKGGEVLDVAGLEVHVAYTPGHASHHVSYYETSSGTAFVGDTGGIRIGKPLLVIPPTPPPDIDVGAWDASLASVRAWKPRRVFIAHFGGFDDPEAHVDDLQRRLHQAAGFVRDLVADEQLTEEQRQGAFVERMMAVFRGALPNDEWVQRYQLAVPVDHCWQGLARYWRKRG